MHYLQFNASPDILRTSVTGFAVSYTVFPTLGDELIPFLHPAYTKYSLLMYLTWKFLTFSTF